METIINVYNLLLSLNEGDGAIIQVFFLIGVAATVTSFLLLMDSVISNKNHN